MTFYSASHYVGYVDDEETPEMIMKKFEMLDKFLEASSKGLLKDPAAPKPKKAKSKRDSDDYAHEKRAPQPVPVESEPLGPDQVLNERQLALLFKMTSSFSVPSDGFIESSFDGYYAPEDFELSDEEKYAKHEFFFQFKISLFNRPFFNASTWLFVIFFSIAVQPFFILELAPSNPLSFSVPWCDCNDSFFVGEDEFFGGDDRKSRRRRKAQGGEPRASSRKEKDLRGVGTYKPKIKLLSMELVGADGMYYTIKKKVKMIDPLQPTYVRIPSQVPLPRSWSRTIAPYTGSNNQPTDGVNYIETNIVNFDLKSLGRNFQGVIIDPPWLLSNANEFTSINASFQPNGGTY